MKLKKCPFCGGTPKLFENGEGGVFIECQSCNASSTMMFPEKCDVKDLLAERWNQRTSDKLGGANDILDHVQMKLSAPSRQEIMPLLKQWKGIVGSSLLNPDGKDRRIAELEEELLKMRKIASCIRGIVWIKAKEEAGFGVSVHAASGGSKS